MSLSDFYDDFFGLRDSLPISSLVDVAQEFVSLSEISPYIFNFRRANRVVGEAQLEDIEGAITLAVIPPSALSFSSPLVPSQETDSISFSSSLVPSQETDSISSVSSSEQLQNLVPPLPSLLDLNLLPVVNSSFEPVLLPTELEPFLAEGLQQDLQRAYQALVLEPEISTGIKSQESLLLNDTSQSNLSDFEQQSFSSQITNQSLFIANNEVGKSVRLPSTEETALLGQSFFLENAQNAKKSSPLTVYDSSETIAAIQQETDERSVLRDAQKIVDEPVLFALSVTEIAEAAALRAIAIIEESLIQELEGRLG